MSFCLHNLDVELAVGIVGLTVFGQLLLSQANLD